MNFFPLCTNLLDKDVILVGAGNQAKEKEERLRPFRPNLIRKDTLCEEDLIPRPIMVVIGDLPYAEAETAAKLCTAKHIPVNVVDVPKLCTFIFPAIITEGDLTVAVSTGGVAPGAAAHLARHIRKALPDNTDEILSWLGDIRLVLRKTVPAEFYGIMVSRLTAHAFACGRVLSEEEYMTIVNDTLSPSDS